MLLPEGRIHLFMLSMVFLLISVCKAAEKEVDYSCNGDQSDANLVNMNIRIIPHQDPVAVVYGFDAASGDTSLSANRIDSCVQDTSGITDVDTDAIVFDLNFDITASVFECGATVTDLSGVTGVKEVTVILRVFAYSITMLSADDDVYVFKCRSDSLNSAVLSAGALDQSTVVVASVIVLQTQYGVYLRLRDAATDVPIIVASLNQEVYMSVEMVPELTLGPDTYGTTFYIGFLGNDAINETSASSLFIVVLPRYAGRTDVIVTTAYGTQQQNVSDRSPMVFNISTDLMGCSDGGQAELAYKGVKVHSFDMEVAVMVYNREADTEDIYTAIPLNVTGNHYSAVSMAAINSVSELMIIGTENDTAVTLSIPQTTTLSVTLNGTTKSAGENVTFTLNERQTFHLAQSSSTVAESVTGYVVTSDKAVSVLSGNREYSKDHIVEQLTTTSKLGDHYVLTPANPVNDDRLTTYMLQAVEPGDTIVTRFLSSTTNETYTINLTTNPYRSITVASDEPCEVMSDKPIMATQFVNPPPSGNTDFEPAMLVMPPVYRWSNEYALHHQDYPTRLVWVTPSTDTQVQVDDGNLLGSFISVRGPNGYQFSSTGITLPARGTPYKLSTSTANNQLYKFLPIAYPIKTGTVNSGSAVVPPGILFADKDYCFPIGYRGDLVDNDCDGLIDEELVDGLDNDGDSLFNEDTIASSSEHTGAVASRPFGCEVSGLADFSDPTKIVSLTKADGCIVNRTGPFAVSENFVNVVTANIGSNTQPKKLKSGNFTLAKFVDSPLLHFKCNVTFCYSASDENCRTICSTTSRRRRQDDGAGTEPPEDIRTDVWIYPYGTGQNTAGTSGGTGQGNVGDVVTTRVCLENTNIQVILSVLLALLLMAFTTALCFCCLFRRRRESDKMLSKLTTNSARSTTSFNKRQFPTRYRF